MKPKYIKLSIVFLSLWYIPAAYCADSTNPEKYIVEAQRIRGKVRMTGKLTDPLWKRAQAISLKYEVQPGENTPAPQRTTVRVLYNSRSIYFGFVCHDTRANLIRAHVTDRDEINGDDRVGVIFDTYSDNDHAYEFLVNPYGIQEDLMRSSHHLNLSFNAVWYSAASMTDSGYTAEIEIPFKSIRFPPGMNQKWRIDFVRFLPRESRDELSWTPLDRNNPCLICQGGTLLGINDTKSSDNLDLLPYVMGYQSRTLNDQGDPASGYESSGINGRVGIGIRYAPSSSLAFGAVLNPDFSQVEADAAQISVNTTFALFYPEKRPFFLEGSHFFGTNFNVFYSRMIDNPIGAVKLTEKSGRLSLGYLGAEDRNSPFIVPGQEGSSFISSSLKSFSNIFRARYDLAAESYVGGIVTARNLRNAHNYVGGIDWTLFFDNNYYFSGQALLSDTKEVNDTSLFNDPRTFGLTGLTAAFDGQRYGGNAARVSLDRRARNYSFHLSYEELSPTFQAQDGFITSTDSRQVHFNQVYTIYPLNSILNNLSFSSGAGSRFNSNGVLKRDWVVLNADFHLKSQTYIHLGFRPYDFELFHSSRFDHVTQFYLTLATSPVDGFSFWTHLTLGRFIDRSDTASLGRGRSFNFGVSVSPTDQLQLNFTYSRSSLSALRGNKLFFEGYIARGEAVYQFTSEVFVRLITQYNQFSGQISVDPLFSYKVNPFTVFYAGSTHSFTQFGYPYGTKLTAQEFFVKFQYLFQG